MKKLKHILNFFRNPYLLIGTAALVWLLFFDRYNVFATIRAYSHIRDLRAELAFYESEQARIAQEGILREDDLEALDVMARERYYMKRENEDVFVIMDAAQLKQYQVQIDED